MARKLAVYFLILTALTALINNSGCSSPDQQEIDQQYINSRTYSSFSKQAEREREQAQTQKGGLTDQLKSLVDCSVSPFLVTPFIIDSLAIAEWIESDNDDCMDNLSNRRALYTLRVLAQSSLNNIKILWVLRSRTSIYKDRELFVTTYGHQGLQNAESIGTYRENLSEKITTHIEVSSIGKELRIVAVENRQIKYPIEQNNAVESIYHIDEEGLIKN